MPPESLRIPAPPLRGAALASAVRREVIEISYRAGVGHIGSSLSIADLVAALLGATLRGNGPDDPDRDRFVLSKGHAVLALYAAMCHTGRLTREELESFGTDGTAVGGHPEHDLPGIDFSTGSLGHGLSLGAGAALAARMQGSARRCFVLLSDAELNEGSVWEAIMFAAQHRLASLTAIVDVNGQQALGYTRDVLDLEPIAERFRVFGWRVSEVDGHDVGVLEAALATAPEGDDRPHVVLARTTFGRGVSYMEGRIAWHYLPMTAEQHRQALDELAAAPS